MADWTAHDLAEAALERWHWFYKKGWIDRRVLLKAILASGGAAGAGAALAACGGESKDYGKESGPAPSGQAQGQQPAQTGKDSITVAFDADLPNLDPHMHFLREGIIFHYHVHDNLGVRDPGTGRIGPHLATSWQPVDPTTWEIDLRKDVKFHNGDPFTAETVKFNWERIIKPEQKSPQQGNHAAIAAVDVIDQYKVRVKTKSPYPIFVERLQNFQMVSEKYVREKGDSAVAENPVGTGPYKFVEWKRDQHILVERNDSYWGPKPGFRFFRYRIIPEKTTQLAEVLAGNVDVMRAVPPDQTGAVNNSGKAKVATQKILRTGFVGFDAKGRTGPSPFTDVRVRNAVNHAVNIDKYIKSLQPGGDRTPALVNPLAFGYDQSVKPHEYDPEKAKSLLNQAGLGGGFEVTFNRSIGSLLPNAKTVYEAMQQDLEKVGVRAKFQMHDTRAFTPLVEQGKGGPMYEWSWGYYSVFDADGILWDMLHSSSPFAYYNNAELDRLLLEGRSTLDEETRKRVYSQAQKIIRDESPAIFMWGFHQLWAVSTSVSWKPDPDEIDKFYTAKPA